MPDEFDEIISDFLTEAEESLDTIDPLFVELEIRGDDKEMLNEIFRSMHTIKGAAGFLGFQPVVDVAHSSESILKRLRDGEIVLSTPLMNAILKSVDMLRLLLKHIKLRDGVVEDITPLLIELEAALNNAKSPVGQEREDVLPFATVSPASPGVKETGNPSLTASLPVEAAGSEVEPVSPDKTGQPERTPPPVSLAESIQTLRVDTDKIDKVMNLTGEVVLIRNRLLNLVSYLGSAYPDDSYVNNLDETVSFLDLVTSDMQLSVMKIRMQPIKKVFGKFPRLVRDIAGALNKDVDLQISGEETEVDKTVIEHIGDPLVHIIRNAVDHGIESKEERRKKGKPEKGTISINAYQKGNKIVVVVTDDGKGIDVERVKHKALEKKLITEEEAARMTDEAAVNLIFLPGFSTQDVATELSGRGVGMDVVKTNISKLNGYVEVMTTKDVRSVFVITIPLTLAIIETLMVRAGRLRYAVPLSPVEEITRISAKEMHDVIGNRIISIRDRVYPIYNLSNVLGDQAVPDADCGYAVIVSLGSTQFCLAVNELLGREEVVIKNIEGVDNNSSSILGATITGDGKVVLVLDLGNISRQLLTTSKGRV
ncbi:MAG: chemotaxis protein CheA [Smithellaceae bacterium]|nr:chemotaxis protein CheA [Smithellaceae bacterium]